MEDEKQESQDQGFQDKKDDGVSYFPDLYPPTIPRPVQMVIKFRYGLEEPVTVSGLKVYGVIKAAAVAFHNTSIVYLIDTGSGPEKWYPETMIRPMPLFKKGEGPLMGGAGTPDPQAKAQTQEKPDEIR